MKFPSWPPVLALAAACLVHAVAPPAWGTPSPAAPITPAVTIVLFDGETRSDLSAFYSWLPEFGRDDPDGVFTVQRDVDGAPAIRISGQHRGGLVTREQYANYRLVAEFRWGRRTWPPREHRARDSGVLLHCQGPDGNARKDFKSPWSRSIAYQITEGSMGDLILVNGFERENDPPLAPTLTVNLAPNGKNWDPAGSPAVLSQGRIHWRHRDAAWRDVLGFRGAKDIEKPVGAWNRLEAICAGGDIAYFLNGVKVNEGRNGGFRSGRLLFQSEGAEIFFRRIELQPLP